MPRSQPQVDFQVNRGLVAPINRGFHADGVETISALGKVIKARLRRLEQTQAWLADAVRVSPQAVTKWIADGEITVDNARAVATALGISVGQLLDPNPDTEADDRWHSLPASMRAHLIGLVDSFPQQSTPPAEDHIRAREKRHTRRVRGGRN